MQLKSKNSYYVHINHINLEALSINAIKAQFISLRAIKQ